MTDNDKLFIQTINTASRLNREGKYRAVVTNKALLSKELLDTFEVDSNAPGAWFFNVYVEFEPMFKTIVAKDWQQ